MSDLISRQAAIDLLRKRLIETANNNVGFTCDAGQAFEDASERIRDWIDELPSAQPEKVCIAKITLSEEQVREAVEKAKSEIVQVLPSAQPEIIRCKDCEYGEQDEVGRWFCRSLGCQIGNEDGSGYCADAERRTDG